MKRWEALAAIAPHLKDKLVVCCNGMLGRDLFGLGDRPTHFYMIGSMGLASSIGLGLALAQPEKKVVVLDGDGNVLMNLGGLANVGAAKPANFYHIIFDNGTHASTGDQRTVSRSIRLEEIARIAGYRRAGRSADPTAFFASEGPACMVVEIEPGNQRRVPRVEVPPPEIAARFRRIATETQRH